MENEAIAASGRMLDPEVQAGRALRRLRMARRWSQEEVATRMRAYGYDFHQTMIAKIEAAQRPLRVRELADFAALYGVEVQDLVYPPTGSLSKIDQEIAEVTARRGMAQAQADGAREQLDGARTAMHNAEAAYQASAAEVAVLEGRLASLLAEREKLISWESGQSASLAEGGKEAERDTLKPERASIASDTRGSTVRRVLGSQLRRLREAQGLTREDAGYTIRASSSKISRLEAGRVSFKERDVTELLTLYGVTDEGERQALRSLAQRANAPHWWHDYAEILPTWFQAYIGLEEAATQIRAYEVRFIPGLLQTEDYARALISLGRDGVPAAEIERRAQLRMARQTVLDRPDPLKLQVVLDESILRRQFCGPTVLHDQIRHLAEMAERPNVSIQVLPFQADRGPAGGPFTILQFAESDLANVVYLEQLTSALYLDTPEHVDSYLGVMQRLCSEALNPRETGQLLKQVIDEPSFA